MFIPDATPPGTFGAKNRTKVKQISQFKYCDLNRFVCYRNRGECRNVNRK